MDNGARLSVINEMKRRLSVEFTPPEGVTLNWREAISRQAQQIRDLVTGRRAATSRWRARNDEEWWVGGPNARFRSETAANRCSAAA
jgi:hypothetical protein